MDKTPKQVKKDPMKHERGKKSREMYMKRLNKLY